MKGIPAYKCEFFHPDCVGVEVLDVGGIPYLWCPECRVYANLQAVAPKFQNVEDAVCSVAVRKRREQEVKDAR